MAALQPKNCLNHWLDISSLILNQLKESVLILNDKFEIIKCNHAFLQLTSKDRNTVTGNNIQSFFSPGRSNDLNYNNIANALGLDHEVQITSNQHEKTCIISINKFMPTNLSLGYIVTISDITKLKTKTDVYSLIFLDLNKLKHVNDSLGHDIGDEILATIGYHAASV